MKVTVCLSAAAIVMMASAGSVNAADDFVTLKGVAATPMASAELGAVKGLHVHFLNRNGGSPNGGPHLAGRLDEKNWYLNGSPDGDLVAPSYHGLCVAAGTPSGISIPTGPNPSQCP